MSEQPSRKITLPTNKGMLVDLTKRIKLIWRLLNDPRVSPWLKLMPVASIAYLIIPDLVIGPIDDAAIIWLATYLFVELCPPNVVEEHMRAIDGKPPIDAEVQDEDIVEGEVIEGESREP
jgi:uncharacterized membrane protein YkvA (DUF1232 family)